MYYEDDHDDYEHEIKENDHSNHYLKNINIL